MQAPSVTGYGGSVSSLGVLMKVLCIFGTRPEIIKLAPVMHAMQASADIEPLLCSTGQHQAMVAQMLDLFQLNLDYDLAIMQRGQTVESITSGILNKLGQVLDSIKPDCLMVQGDTTSAFVSGLIGFYRNIKVLHLEAGLRSGDMQKPWPEEANRKLLSVLSNVHFAPTKIDAENLKSEGVVCDNIHVVGNSVVDAVAYVQQKIEESPVLGARLDEKFKFISKGERFILVTGHRRESHGGGHAEVFKVLKRIAQESKMKIIFPVHLNPLVRDLASDILKDSPDVFLLDPVDYVEMQYLLKRCYFVITDSGGIQEEAPSYGKPLLITREVTERMAGVISGSAILVGTDAAKIYDEAMRLIRDVSHYSLMSKTLNPYGDGKTSARVCKILKMSIPRQTTPSGHAQEKING